MATFQAQVEGLTQLTMGSGDAPSTTELTQFLKDGVLDTTGKWLIGHPQDRELFMDETDLQVAQGANIDGADIISVVRADGVTAGNFRACKRITQGQQSVVTDVESLSYASKYNPAYMLNSDNSVAVFPAPSDNSGKDSYKIYYINNTPLDSTGNALTYADSALRSFPANKVYLVVLYASVQTLQAAMSNNIVSLSMTVPTGPIVPALTAVTFTSIDSDIDATAPVFTTATVSAADIYSVSGADDPGAFSLNAVPPSVPSNPNFTTIAIDSTSVDYEIVGGMPDVSATTISSFGTAPSFVPPSTSKVTTYIETNQDVELASAKLQEVNTQMQAALNTFNEQQVAYQAEVQQNIQQAQIAAQEASQQAQLDASQISEQARLGSQTKQSQAQINAQEAQQETSLKLQKETQEYSATLQKYGSEIGVYQSEVNKEVQQYTQKLQRWQLLYQSAIQESFKEVDIANGINIAKAQADLQLSLSNEDRSMQRQLQNGINDMQAINSDNQSNISKYQSEISDYQAEIAVYQAEVAKEIQESTTKMQQYQGLYLQLLQQYNAAFQTAEPQQQEQRR